MSKYDQLILVMLGLSLMVMAAFSFTVGFLLSLDAVVSSGGNYGGIVFAILFGVTMLAVGKGALDLAMGAK